MATSPPDESTVAPSPTSPQQTLPGLDSGTSLPASADGLTPSDSPGSMMTPTSGPGHAPVSRSQTRGRGVEFSTLDIFGQHGSHSSSSVSLQSSLESRLRAEMVLDGSTLFTLTWSDAVTPSGRRICALRASVHRTSDNVCTSWPTPTVSRGDYSYAHGNHETPTLKLAGAAKLASWPTSNKHGDNSRPLNEVARLAHWATPLANEAAGGGSERHIDGRRSDLRAGDSNGGGAPTFAHGGRDLKNMVKMASWPTTRACDGAKGGKRRVKTGQDLPTTVQLASWATPAAQEAGGTPEGFIERKRQAKAKGTNLGVSLTSLSLQAQLVDSGETPSGSSAETPPADPPSPGQLNPEHSRWLQGYPVAWGFCGGTVTRSSRR